MPCFYYNDGPCSRTKHHGTKGIYYRHICSVCFVQNKKVTSHTAGECKQNIQTRVKLGMATVYHNGHAHTGSLNQRPFGNQRKGIYCNSKADILAFGVGSHIWKKCFAVSNSYKPAVLNRTNAQVLSHILTPKASQVIDSVHPLKQTMQNSRTSTLILMSSSFSCQVSAINKKYESSSVIMIP